jgi:ATP-grasp domain, R2K clade family 3
MSVTWILEPDMCATYYKTLVAEIALQGHLLQEIPAYYTTIDWGDTDRFYKDFSPKGSCVICHASIQFTSQVAEDELWVPGVYGTSDATDCSHYFPHFDDVLLNNDCEFVSLNDLIRSADSLFKTFSIEDRIFIRPDSGRKPFSGRLYTRTELISHLLRTKCVSPNSLVVVSRPKAIRFEWRFIVADRNIIAASMYKDQEVVRMSTDVPHEAFDFASVVAARKFQPDRVWVLDICELSNGDMKAVEINGFSSSSWYSCSVKDIVTIVSRVAVDDWKRSMSTSTKVPS